MNLSRISGEETIAQNEYDDLYYSLDSEGEAEQDFHEPLQNYVSGCLRVTSRDIGSSLEVPLEAPCILNLQIKSANDPGNKTHLYAPNSTPKTPLNRRMRRRLAKEILWPTQTKEPKDTGDKARELIELRQHMS